MKATFQSARKINRHRHITDVENGECSFHTWRMFHQKKIRQPWRESRRLKRCGVRDAHWWDYPKEKFPKQFIHWLELSECGVYCEWRQQLDRYLIRNTQQFRKIRRDLRTDRDFTFFFKKFRVRMQFTGQSKMRVWIGETDASFDKWGNSTLNVLDNVDIPSSRQEFVEILNMALSNLI